MDGTDFQDKVLLTLLDKGSLALILLIAGYWLNQKLEAFKSQLSSRQEASRDVKAAVLDLAKKLAAGSHVISWPTWTPDNYTWLDETKFATYQKEMGEIVNELVGLQARLAALDSAKHRKLRPFANELYARDNEATLAMRHFLDSTSPDRSAELSELKKVYEASLDFDERLLAAVTNLIK